MPQTIYDAPIIRWITATTLNHIVFTQSAIQWKTLGRINKAFPIQWYVGARAFDMQPLRWTVSSVNPQPDGIWYPTFTARHTGEANSAQVIRIRSAWDSTKIIYESPAESSTTGFIAIDCKLNDYVNPKGVVISAYRESDFSGPSYSSTKNLTNGTGDKLLSFTDLPGYVTQEYKSTTRRDYIIRYLGYLTPNPENSVLSTPKKPYDANKSAQKYGYTVVGRNLTGFAVILTVKFSDGRVLTGMLPANQALVIRKTTGTKNQIGYVPLGVFQGVYQPEFLQDGDLINGYFKPLTSLLSS
jgi:hypothetical protein